MNELMSECETSAMEALRFKSRFDEFDPERYYKDALFNFSTGFMAHDGGISVSVTSEATRYGIRKPVALSCELYRKWIYQGSCLTVQRIQNHQRNQFLRKLIRTIIITAIGRQHRQALGVMPRAHEVIGSCFTR